MTPLTPSEPFRTFVFSPAGLADVTLVVAACRAGGVGVLNAELGLDAAAIVPLLDRVAGFVPQGYGVKLAEIDALLAAALQRHAALGLRWLIVEPAVLDQHPGLLADLRAAGVKLLVEVLDATLVGAAPEARCDGLVLKGNESGGFVGDDASFILLQKWHGRTTLPLYLRGGMTPAVAAACHAVGLAGGVLDAQVLLMPESPLRTALQPLLASLSGNETLAVGDGEHGEYFRILLRPGHTVAKAFSTEGDGQGHAGLRGLVQGKLNWADPKAGLLPVGHDICFAAPWARQHGHLAGLLRAIDDAVAQQLRQAVQARSITAGAPLAQALGIPLPLIQGPMTRVSDVAAFAQNVAEGGALPMVALALLKGQPLVDLLEETAQRLGDKPWGIGLLGFSPQPLLDEQLAVSVRFKPSYAIIAGGRPDQAVTLEQAGIPTFLHVPSANLLPMFLAEGARRFIFEGRECGGHIGPLSSCVLWTTMVERLLAELPASKVKPEDIQLIFAGGIHDALSSAFVQVLTAPLAAKGVRIGILMGSAYLFTEEIVSSGAVVQGFQDVVIACERTVNLESGPGHASRCGYTAFAEDFFRQRAALRAQQMPADEARRVLDDLILGRLRIASKGRDRGGEGGALRELTPEQQQADGMYMLGQVAMLRERTTRIAALHREVTEDAAALLAHRLIEAAPQPDQVLGAGPADVAIVGISTLLPKANSTREFWQNIVDKVDAITEIPRHRWDWRLYFSEDRHEKDKIYSKWGGFLDDMPFDPTRYGMPPKSVDAIDPMQIMALEVAQRALVDAGYADKYFNRERASVIIGASGGTGDVGTQYGLRAELPRFSGQLPDDIANRLPEWTEDSFAGILVNVIAGRIANRLNFGGANFTTDAACGSSLAAVYQGVSELIAGRSDFVLAGGVDTVQGPFGYLCFSKTQALSPRGRCSTFDSTGDGIAISEGLAMIALKRLADAERDGDRIYAVIKGVGASSDGNAKGMTAPLPAGQLRAMRRTYAQAGYGPDSVGLFEAHGTGTVAGDTAELESTTTLIREHKHSPRQAVVGSVKTMIGHTKATAGVAGLVKAALALHHQVLPPHLHVKVPNAILRDESSPLHVLAEPMPWLPDGDTPRRASVSAFGFGGTNFHVTMQEYRGEYREWLKPVTTDRWPAELLLLGEADKAALLQRLGELATGLAAAPALEVRDLAASLARDFTTGGETLAIVAEGIADLAAKLDKAQAFLRGEAKALPPGVYHGAAGAEPGKLAVLFPGQGSQYTGMLRDLAVRFPECAATLAEADAALKAAFDQRFGAGHPLSRFILPRGAYSDDDKAAATKALTSTDVAQPALGAVSVAVWRLMQSLGLKADMAAGHSYGEFVALHAAGAFDFAALMQLSAARGRFIVDAAKAGGSELGTMAAVPAVRKDVEAAIAGIDGVIVANHNAPLQSIVSGTHAAVKQAIEALAKAGIEATPIPVAAAFHSVLVQPAQAQLAAMIEATPWSATRIPVYSNARAEAHDADVQKVRQCMAEHLVQPVEFVAEIEAMVEDGARTFVEVGPKSVLSKLVGKILAGRPHLAVATDDGSGIGGLLKALGQLACAGVALDWQRLFAGRDCRLGDTDNLAAMQRVTALPRHAWLLNGSRARRAGEPPQQVGVTLEELPRLQAAAATSPPVAPAADPLPAAPPAASANAAVPYGAPAARSPFPTSPRSWKKEVPMTERRTVPPAAGGSAVMSEYFDTMRQFLETQERVMAMFMGAEVSAPAARPMLRPLARPAAQPLTSLQPLQRVSEVEATPVPQPAAAAKPVPAAVVPPAPAPVPAPVAAAPAPVPAAAPAQKAAPAPAPAATADTALGRDKLADMLLAIVEDKTGYPRDMVGLDQNLESDLGIDSIKRIEVVGAMMQKLPEGLRAALTDSRTKLNTQPTLNGMLDILAGAKQGATVPFEVAEAAPSADQGSAALAALPPRYAMQAVAEPIPSDVARQLNTGHWLVAPDATGQLADTMSAALAQRGCTVHRLPRELLADEAGLAAWIAAQRATLTPLAGLLHLAPVGSAAIDPQGTVDGWRRSLQANEKSLYQLLHGFSAALADGSQVLAASALGGGFGRSAVPAADGLLLQGGAPGVLKSLLEERPTLRVKAIDLDPAAQAAWGDQLLDELLAVGGRQEVGYPQGQRTIFRTVEAPAAAPHPEARLDDIVVLATGGARGITAEVLRELARPGNTLVLTGRSALPATESADTAALDNTEKLRQFFVAQARAGAIKIGDVPRKVQAVLGEREMRQNIADFRQRGAAVEYHAVNVTREADLAALVADVRGRLGAIHGIVHGAGVIEDKLLADKQPESWSRVVETKVIGLLLLHKLVPAADLRFINIFSSVAGRYGNSGQSDYATANELMNRLGAQLAQRAAGRLNVRAMCWGPWGPTLFGAGMVTEDTEAKFAAKGVLLVQAAQGRRLFLDELRGPAAGPLEVICGVGPWEQREADNGRFTRAALDASAIRGPLIGAATIEPQPTGSQVVRFTIDNRHAYLNDHAIDGKPVLPAAAALEVFAEAARALWPGWQVVELRELRLMKGIELPEMPRSFTVLVQPPPYGSSEGFEVDATLQTELEAGRKLIHYRTLIRLEQQFGSLPAPAARRHAEKRLAVDKAYADWLFHGAQFQVIEAIKGLSAAGAAATVRTVSPQDWLPAIPQGAPGWVFDPAVVDAAPQMAILWDRALHDQTCLPTGFGRVQRCRAEWPSRLQMVYEALDSDDAATVRANVYFLDEGGAVVLAIEDMRCVSSQALNRLAAAANRKVTA